MYNRFVAEVIRTLTYDIGNFIRCNFSSSVLYRKIFARKKERERKREKRGGGGDMSDKNFSCKSERRIRLNSRVGGMQERALDWGCIRENERDKERKEGKRGEKGRKGNSKAGYDPRTGRNS